MNNTMKDRAFEIANKRGIDWVTKQIMEDTYIALNVHKSENQRKMANIRIQLFQEWLIEQSMKIDTK